MKTKIAGLARRVRVRAPRERVYRALTTLAGIRGWWTKTVEGRTQKGGELRLRFVDGDGIDEHFTLRVDGATRPSSVAWSCVEQKGDGEWIGTEITFELVERPEATCEVRFVHAGLTPKLACYGECRSGWDYFLASLKAYVEEGKGTPFGVS